MATKSIKSGKIWKIAPIPEGDDRPAVIKEYIKTLDAEIELIKPDELSGTGFIVAGQINTRRKKFTDDEYAVADFGEMGKVDVLQKVKYSKLVGYLPTTSEDCYIAVQRQRKIPLPLPALIIAGIAIPLIALALVLLFMPPSQQLQTDSNQVARSNGSGDNTTQIETMRVPAYTEIKVSASNPTTQLYNPPDNSVLFKYTVSNDAGTVLHQSGWIEPGMATVWDAWSSYGGALGTYEATIVLEVAERDGSACNGTTQPVPVKLS